MYQCKQCKHPVHDYTTENINEWMGEAVVLLKDGTRLVGKFDSEHGHKVGERETDQGGVWLHKVCWEAASKPEFDAYEQPSKRMDECSYEDEELWIITPSVTDEQERERLLAVGIKAHKGRLFDQQASELDNLIETDPEWLTAEQKEFPWRQMFQVHGYRDEVQIYNKLTRDHMPYEGTEEDADAECKRLFEAFLVSDECKALQARRAVLSAEWKAKHLEKLKKEGRFQVSYRPAKTGDRVKHQGERDWVGSRSIYYVTDKLTYDDVAVMDGPNKALGVQSFVDEYPEDRVEEMRAAHRESQAQAEALAKNLNSDWADAGYPGEDWVAPV